EHCLVFEDSPTGAEAARRAGAAAIIMTTTHPAHEFNGADHIAYYLDDFSGLALSQQEGEWQLAMAR
ncbi:MAG: HAD family phosphatase, partial [Lewinella sp.]|nr:HAD family phosphatase [Lewinella sp.]